MKVSSTSGIFLATGALFALCSAEALATSYVITDLGTLGTTHSVGQQLNNAGQVTGWFGSLGPYGLYEPQAFLYSGGSMQAIGPSGNYSVGAGINNLGQVTGSYYTGTAFHAFLYSNGVLNDLGTRTTTVIDPFSFGRGINDLGQVTGWSTFSGYAGPEAVVFADGAITTLGSFDGMESYGLAINNAGQVTGYSTTGGDPAYDFHAFLYREGTLNDLDTLGGLGSQGRAINDSGQVTGWSDIDPDFASGHAFIYSAGAMIDLGTLGGLLSSGVGINNAGQVTGSSQTQAGDTHAFLFSDGVMTDLNNLIAADSGWLLAGANDINDFGQITGVGIIDGQSHAYLMTPTAVPEPSTIFLLSLGLGGFAICRGKLRKPRV